MPLEGPLRQHSVSPRSFRGPLLLLVAIGMTAFGVVTIMTFLDGEATPLRYYRFLSGRALEVGSTEGYKWVIVKGRTDGARIQGVRSERSALRLANYEQAAALNRREARYARDRGWLALTCDGDEIHPKSIPGVTLLDITIEEALRWRAQQIADETTSLGYDGSYLDTLRSYYPVTFYDGIHCIDDVHSQWLLSSIELLKLVRARTNTMVLANGAGLQSGKNYRDHESSADRLIEAADGVQIEHFFRNPRGYEADLDFVQRLIDRGKLVFVKNDGDAEAASMALSDFPRVLLNVDD
jgi:hypothetical protein